MKDVVEKIRLKRIEKGFSQEYVAGKLDLAKSAYSRFEQGSTKKIDLILVEQIAKILDTTVSDLISTEGDFLTVNEQRAKYLTVTQQVEQQKERIEILEREIKLQSKLIEMLESKVAEYESKKS